MENHTVLVNQPAGPRPKPRPRRRKRVQRPRRMARREKITRLSSMVLLHPLEKTLHLPISSPLLIHHSAQTLFHRVIDSVSVPILSSVLSCSPSPTVILNVEYLDTGSLSHTLLFLGGRLCQDQDKVSLKRGSHKALCSWAKKYTKMENRLSGHLWVRSRCYKFDGFDVVKGPRNTRRVKERGI